MMRHCVCLLAGGLFTTALLGADPPSKPYLRIETGMHTAMIRRIDADAAGRFLVSVSDDKTARVWDLQNGKLLQVLRPRQGDGDEGKLNAVAISPDGTTVALGGWISPSGMDESIYLFDRETGALRRRINGLPNIINHLAYSPDGRYLAAALWGGHGIRVYRTNDYQETGRDTQYADSSYWVEFDRTGRLVTGSYDGFVRLYSATLQLIEKKQAPGGKQPYAARFSPDGSKIAVGFDDSTAVNVLSGADLSPLYSPDTRLATGGNLVAVAWSPDGSILYAGGRYTDNGCPVLSWPQEGHGVPRTWPAALNTVMDIRALPGGRLAFGSAQPEVGVIDDRGGIVWRRTADTIDHRGNMGKFRVSPDGSVVQFGFDILTAQREWDRRLARFDVGERKFAVDPAPDASLNAPRMTGLNVTDWEGTAIPKLDGRNLSLDQYEISRSLAISRDAGSFLLGTEWWLRLYDRQGHDRKATVPGVTWAVNLTSDGRYAVAAFGDGTIRWYNVSDLQEVLALFVHRDGKRWVAWTPDGFFDASPGGEELVGYHLNQGLDRQGEFIKIDQVYNLFYRPDLVSQRLKPGGAEALLAARERIGDIQSVLAGGLPPDLELLSPAESSSDGNFELRMRVKNRGGGVGRVVFRIDGAEIQGRAVGIPVPGGETAQVLPVPPGRHQVTAAVYNGRNQLESRSVSVWVNVREDETAPNLFVVAAGVSNYRDHSLLEGVKFAASDAQTVASTLKAEGAGLFPEVTVYALPDSQATRDNISRTVSQAAAKMKAGDVFVLYLAGHGTAQDGQYYFIPWEARYTSGDALLQQSLDQETLRKMLEQIPARKTLLVLDTCSAGAFANQGRALGEKAAIGRLAKITGRAIMAASASDQMALEGFQNHGVFTAAFLEGLVKAADDQGRIQVGKLADFIGDRVPEITLKQFGYEQTPMLEITGQTFPIARRPH
jgi:WD40 repeat protein